MHSQKIIAIVLMLFSAVFFAATFQITVHTFATGLSARFWPQMMLVILFGFAALLYAQARQNQGKEPQTPWRHVAICCAFFVAYVLGLEILGYLFATLFFQMLFLRYLGIRSFIGCVVFPCVITATLILIFVKGLGVMLPYGTGPFHAINTTLWS